MSILLYMGGAIGVLALLLFIAVKAYLGKRKEAMVKSVIIEQQRKAIDKRDAYIKEWELIRNDIEKKKADLHSGNDSDDFHNSVGMLHELSSNRKPPA